MRVIKVKKLWLDGNCLHLSTRFKTFNVDKSNVRKLSIKRVPSLVDEIGIELEGTRKFLITERVEGFLDLANFLCLDELFGVLWYRDAEDGHELSYAFEHRGIS